MVLGRGLMLKQLLDLVRAHGAAMTFQRKFSVMPALAIKRGLAGRNRKFWADTAWVEVLIWFLRSADKLRKNGRHC